MDAYRPLLDLLDSIMITPAEFGARWRYSDDHLCNLRRGEGLGRGFGCPRGRSAIASNIMGSEIAGTCGRLTLDQVC